MKLTFKTLAGKTFTVEAEESETVRPASRTRANPPAPVGAWAGPAPLWVEGGRSWGRAAGGLGGAPSHCSHGMFVLCVGDLLAVGPGDLRAAVCKARQSRWELAESLF